WSTFRPSPNWWKRRLAEAWGPATASTGWSPRPRSPSPAVPSSPPPPRSCGRRSRPGTCWRADRPDMRTTARALAGPGLPPLSRTVWVADDTDQLTRNAQALADLVAPLQLGVVVKADGYGHGLEVAARCAVRGGATWLCVATLQEAVRLRADGYPGRVFVLYPIPESQAATAGRLDVDVSLGSLADFERVAAVSGLAVHIEIDTGMTRGGCRPEEFASLVGAVRRSSLR